VTEEELKILQWYKIQGIADPMSDNRSNPSKDLHEKIDVVKHIFRESEEQNSRDMANSCNDLESLKASVLSFEGCSLKKTATNMVFSDGNCKARVMLVGEAPGANEDIQGIPFCGESGKLLDQILLSIGLSRQENVYITNSVFWRPPGNRKPTDEEVKICLPFLEKHISLIKPDVLIVVGAVALYALFQYVGPISKMRRQVLSYSNQYLQSPINAITIFHPAYLLRQPSQKKSAWEDMLIVKGLLGKN